MHMSNAEIRVYPRCSSMRLLLVVISSGKARRQGHMDSAQWFSSRIGGGVQILLAQTLEHHRPDQRCSDLDPNTTGSWAEDPAHVHCIGFGADTAGGKRCAMQHSTGQP